jgi:hypothetical protein
MAASLTRKTENYARTSTFITQLDTKRSTDRPRTVMIRGDTTALTATYDLGDSLHDFTPLTHATAGQPDLTVNALSLDGEVLYMWTTIDPQSTDSSGTTYKVYVHNYQGLIFDHWEDDSTDRIRTLTIEEATTITAYYQIG